MSNSLPEGFSVDQKTAPPAEGLPQGFKVDPPAAKPNESVLPFLADRAKSGMTSLLGLAGAPVSAVNQVLNIADSGLNAVSGSKGRHLSSEDPLGGIGQVTRGWEDLLGVKKTQPPKDDQGKVRKSTEYLGKIAEFAGGSLLPGVGAVAEAQQKLATAAVIAFGDLSAATTSIEAKQFTGEHAAAFGLTKEQGEQVGEAVGGVLGPAGVMKLGQKFLQGVNASAGLMAKHDMNGVGKEAQKAAANQMLVKEINTALSYAPASAENIARSMALAKRIPGWNPTLAQQSNAPGLVALQREIANKSPESLAKAAAVDTRNQKAIADFTQKSFPAGKGSITDPASVKLSVDKWVLEASADKHSRDLRALSDKFRRTVDNEAIGDALRKKYWEARTSAKAVVDQELGQVYSTARKYNITEDMSDVREAVNKIVTSDRTTFQDMPMTFQKVLREYPQGSPAKVSREALTPVGAKRPIFRTVTEPAVPAKNEASFEELHSLYKEANKDWIDAVAAGNNSKARYMEMVRTQLQQKVAKYSQPQYGELSQRFQQYNGNYQKYSQTFREGAGGEIAKRTKAGLATDSEDIVRKVFLQSGDKKKGIQDFFHMFGENEDAADLLHDGLVDNFSKAAVKDGLLNPKAAAAWLKRNETAMKELPELSKSLSGTQKTAETLVNRQKLLQVQRKVLDRTVLAKVARSNNPELLIQQALSNTQEAPRLMKALLVGAHSLEDKQAIARSIADTVAARPDAFEYLAANEKSLKPVMDKLGEGHWQNLKDIAEMEQISKRVVAPTQVELSKLQDIGEQTIGTSVKGMLSRLRNMDKPMGVSKEYMVADVGGRFLYKIRSEELARLRENAIFDPETAALLVKLARRAGPPTEKELLDLQRLSFNAGAVSTAGAAGQEEERQRKQGGW